MTPAELLELFPKWARPSRYDDARAKDAQWWARQIAVRLHLQQLLETWNRTDEDFFLNRFDELFEQIQRDPFADTGYRYSRYSQLSGTRQRPVAVTGLTVARALLLADLCRDRGFDVAMKFDEAAAQAAATPEAAQLLSMAEIGHLVVDLNAKDEILREEFDRWLQTQRRHPSRPGKINGITPLKLDEWRQLRFLFIFDLTLWHARNRSALPKVRIFELAFWEGDTRLLPYEGEGARQRFKNSIQPRYSLTFSWEMVKLLSTLF